MPAPDVVNAKLRQNVTAAIQSLFPLVTADGKSELRVTNITMDGSFNSRSLNDMQSAREQGKTLAENIKADIDLVRDGKTVQSAKGLKIGELPLMNQAFGSFTVSGNDLFVPLAQLRLKPGAYTRRTPAGPFETFIPMRGASMSVWMDPAKGVFKIGQGSTNVDWYPIVRSLGATDEDIVRALGGDENARKLLEANRKTDGSKDVDKLFEQMNRLKVDRDLVKGNILDKPITGTLDQSAKVSSIGSWLKDHKLDTFVTKKTLGQELGDAGLPTLMASAKKILEVQRSEVPPDDVDAPEFKTAHAVYDLLPERMTRYSRVLTKKAIRRLADPDSRIRDIISTNWIDPLTTGYFGGSVIEGGLAHTAEAANPLAILSENSKLTVKGEGGIQNDHAITLGARLFRPTATNFVDSVHTPEKEVGVMTHAAWTTDVENKTLTADYFKVNNGRADTRKPIRVSVETASESVVGFPEYWNTDGTPKADTVRVIKDNKIQDAPAKTVQYLIPSGATMFDATSNSALFFHHTHPNRGMMAGKHLTQALPLINRELPLVTLTGQHTGEDMYAKLGRGIAVMSDVAGKVTKVTDKGVWVDGVEHQLFDRYPMQAKVSIHHTPVVKVGDTVKKGDILADSNYTKNGSLALGVNLLSAYTPWKNASNFEDAIVISESASKHLTSEHTHTVWKEQQEGEVLDSKLFMAQFPTKLTSANLAKLDDRGIVKVGSKIMPGDILIAGLRKREYRTDDKDPKNLGNIHKLLMRPWADDSEIWKEDFPGDVTKVLMVGKTIKIFILTQEPAGVGDKLSMSSAAKGTISEVVPDDRMPQDEKGRSIQIILNPHGVAGRINPSQTLEQAAGKLAKDGGVTYTHSLFDGIDHARELVKALDKKGLKHEEFLFDPETNRKTENPVGVGWNYVVKLDHPIRKKFSARERDSYTQDETPTVGKGQGGQSSDHLTTYALLGHNAHAILGESFGVRSTKNDDYWLAYQAGETPPPPRIPFVFEKFRNYLTAVGVDTEQKGNVLRYQPMTDKKIREMSNGEISNARMLRGKDTAEEKGGLFDPETTGGMGGPNWTHLELGHTHPHPLYEKVIKDVTDMKNADYLGLIAGTRHYDTKEQKFQDEAGEDTVTGAEGFKHLLNFDVDEKLRDTKKKLETAVGSDRNRYHRAARYLNGLKETGMEAKDAYLTNTIGVIPPKFRPIAEMKDGSLRVADSNLLYRDVMLTRNVLNDAEKSKHLTAKDQGKARLALYDSHAALLGLGKALTTRGNEDIKGFIETIRGKHNKQGMYQSMVTRRRNDYSGRSVIEGDASLGPDEIMIPDKMAWKLYSPVLVRRLAQLGLAPKDAMAEVEKRSLVARNALTEEMKERPVLWTRAPSLHRWSIMAAKPTISDGEEIRISPISIGPAGADFDGDQQFGLVLVKADKAVLSAQQRAGGPAMAARFNVSTAVRKGHAVGVVHLEDFPHGPLVRRVEGAKGPIEFYDALPGTETLALDEVTGKPIWAAVSHWSKHFDREVELVQTTGGRIIATDDDPRAIYGLDPATMMYARDTPTNAQARGIAIPRVRFVKSKPTLFSLQPDQSSFGPRVALLKPTIELTQAFGYFTGALVGNGWVAEKEGVAADVCFAMTDRAVRDKFEAALVDLFALQAPEGCIVEAPVSDARYGHGVRTTYTSHALAAFMAPLIGHGARSKHLPEFFLSAPREFRLGLFAGLIDTDGCISVSHAKAKSQMIANYSTTSLRLAQELVLLAASLDIGSSITNTETPAGLPAYLVSFGGADIKRWAGEGCAFAPSLAAIKDSPFPVEDSPVACRHDAVPMPRETALAIRSYATAKKDRRTAGRAQEALASSRCGRATMRSFLALDLDFPHRAALQALVDNAAVRWEWVKSITKSHRETGYDLTVPGYETFTSIDGIVLSNTVAVHVPLTDAAKAESFKLLPSNNLFYDRDRSVAFAPEKDIITGIFMLTRQGTPSGKTYASHKEAIDTYHANKDSLRMDSLVTIKGESGLQSIGWLIFQAMVPPRFRTGIAPPITKDKLEKLVDNIAKQSPGDFNSILRAISMAGFTASARAGGITASVNELVVDRSKVNRLLDTLENAIAKGSTDEEKREIAGKHYNDITKPAVDEMVESHLKTIGSGGSVFMAAKPSSKLGYDSYRQMLASPILVKDVNDRIAPQVIRSSYGGGMTPSDYVLTTPGARAGIAARSLSTALPGFLAKVVAGNMADVRVTEKDCGTQHGVTVPLKALAGVKQHDVDMLDRHLLRDVPGTTFKRNDLVTVEMLSKLRDAKIETIEVRSPMTCEALRPPCQMCVGTTPEGKLHPIGANVGYNYGQSTTERSTQLVMRSFHSGGTVGSGDSLSAGFARLNELLSAPATVKGQGVLAEMDGHVHDIRPAPQGGSYVDIKETDNKIHEHYIPAGRKVIVKANQALKAGDPLSDGSYLPQEIAHHKGILAAQTYVVDEARKAYQNAGAIVRKPVLEVVVAGLMRNMEIIEDGGEPSLTAGDIVSENKFNALKAKNPKIKGRPAILGLNKGPLHKSDDLLERLNFQRLEDALREVPAVGGSSDLTGERGSPMSGLAYGVKFREGSFGPRGDKAEFGHVVDSGFDKRGF